MFGHGHHGKEEEERRRREEEERLRWEREKHQHHQQPHHHSPPPPPMASHHGAGYGGPSPPPHVSNVQHVSHEAPHHSGPPPFTGAPGHLPSTGHHQTYPPPPPAATHHAAPPPPAYGSNVQHVSHEAPHHQPSAPGGPSFAGTGHFPSTGHNQQFSSQKTYRIYPKAGEKFSLTIRNGQVVLAKADHKDEYQHWYKDEKYSTKVKDQEGCPAFALVNKVTGEAIKHAIGQEHPVRLIQYNPNYLDESVLWTESKEIKNGFRCIRMVNNIKLAFDAFNGDKEHGGVHDGTTVVLWEPWNGDNEIWKIVSY